MNPGNSGGPVVNSRDQLVAIVVQVNRQAENISFLVPIQHVIEARETRMPRRIVPALTESDHAVARHLVDYIYVDPLGQYRAEAASEILEYAPQGLTPIQSVLLSARLWHYMLSLREDEPNHPRIETMRQAVLSFCRSALQPAPYLQVPFSFARRVVSTEGRIQRHPSESPLATTLDDSLSSSRGSPSSEETGNDSTPSGPSPRLP